MKKYILKFLTLGLLILSIIEVGNAQKLTAKQRVAKVQAEQTLLDGYSTKSWGEKTKALEGIANLWFDTSLFNVTIQRNESDFPLTESFQAIGLLKRINGNAGRNERIILFNQETGKIKKVLDLKSTGPYIKTKLPLLDEIDEYDAERIGVQKKVDGKANRSLIKRYLTTDWAQVDQDGYVLLTFHKIGLTGAKKAFTPKIKEYKEGILTSMPGSKIVDWWSTCILFDSVGNEIFNSGDLNVPSAATELSKDRKFLIISLRGAEDMNELSNRWDGDGFVVYDLTTKKEIYKYQIPLDDRERFYNGSTFDYQDGKPTGYIVNDFSFPEVKGGKSEQLILDVSKRKIYKISFTGDEGAKMSKIWKDVYKSYKNIVEKKLLPIEINSY